MKKKGWIILAVVVVVVLMLFSWFKGTYNDMVARSEAVQAQLGNIENQYQRRADLIPNLVNTVKGYAKHEESTFTQVVEARAKATQTQLNIDDAAAMDKYVQAQGEGTENRIAVERRKYNESARDFNTYIKMFPRNLLSGMFGFAPMGYFEAQEGAQNAPAVSFE